MAVTIKSPREIDLMRRAGEILAATHEELKKAIHPGISTLDIDKLGERIIRGYGCIPSFKNYNGYPASICISVNDEVVHGIPNRHRILKEGDIVSLDAGVIYKGYHSDAARTWAVGEVSPEAQTLMNVTRQSFFEGIKQAREGNHLYDISAAIDDYVSQFGYGIVHDQDKRLAWSEVEKKEIATLKEIHGHWVIKFALGKGGDIGKFSYCDWYRTTILGKSKKGTLCL